MGTKRHKPEDVVAELRQMDVLVSQGPERRGRDPHDRRDGGDVLSLAQGVRRPEERSGPAHEGLGDENQGLRKVIADLTLDTLILQEAVRGN